MIQNIEIYNYKCFKEFGLKDVSGVNLITGKNNVGKTAFMEAVYLATQAKDSLSLIKGLKNILMARRNVYDLDFLYDNESVFSVLIDGYKALSFKINHDYPLSININDKSLRVDDLFSEYPKVFSDIELKGDVNSASNFIFSSLANGLGLESYYASVVENYQDGRLNESLTLFDSNIKSLKMLPDKRNGVLFKVDVGDKLMLLNSFGEGVSRFITILSAIWASKNGYLFVDEIENGIHYTKLGLLWEMVFKNARRANVQVFATTHSKECIEAFSRCQQEDSRLLEFYYADKVKVKSRQWQQLQYALEVEGAFRGE